MTLDISRGVLNGLEEIDLVSLDDHWLFTKCDDEPCGSACGDATFVNLDAWRRSRSVG